MIVRRLLSVLLLYWAATTGVVGGLATAVLVSTAVYDHVLRDVSWLIVLAAGFLLGAAVAVISLGGLTDGP